MEKESINQVPPPFLVSYSITTKCNLMCKHCYSESVDQAAPDELSTEEAFRLMDDLSKWEISLLVIDGGEPLCREDMLDVVKYASSKGLRTTLGSNGTLIDEAMQASSQSLYRLTELMLKPMTHLGV
ncbi:GTP 3',8-cyclase [subsurface metagenome]